MQLITDTLTFKVPGMDADGFDTYIEYAVPCSLYLNERSSTTADGRKTGNEVYARFPIAYYTFTLSKGMTVLHGTDKYAVKGYTVNSRGYMPHVKVILG